MSEYEILRERNMAEIKKELERLNFEPLSKKAVKREAVLKDLPSAQLQQPRRSSRPRKAVYEDFDLDWEEPSSKKKSKARSDGEAKAKRSLRTVAKVNYDFAEPDDDSFIRCNLCFKDVQAPCAIHGDEGIQFASKEDYNLQVGASAQGSKSGQGLWNRGKDIPAGVIFGPYGGTFIPKEEYKKLENEKRESGYAWEIVDSETMTKVTGYVDPGTNFDCQENPLAKANCPSTKSGENMASLQYKAKLYYRSIKIILSNTEVLIDYGAKYAAELGIDRSTWATYKGKEDHTTEAVFSLKCQVW